MFIRALVACTALAAFAAHADPISFYDTQYDVTAIAQSDGLPDYQTANTTTDFAAVSAASSGFNVATAGAIGGGGLLSSSADVTSVDGNVTSAVSTSHFVGSFVSTGSTQFDLDYLAMTSAVGSGGGDTSLFMTFTSGGSTLFNDYVATSQLFSFATLAGTAGTLELTLTSEANGGFLSTTPGSYSSFGQVTLTSPVPEPQSVALMAAGLMGLLLSAHRRRRQSAS